jgi:acyl-CoA thioester hydrolase
MAVRLSSGPPSASASIAAITGEVGVLHLADFTVAPEWVDYNGHMNDAAYALAFSRCGDTWMERIGLGAETRAATGYTLYTLQIMLHYFREAKVGEPLRILAQLLEFDAKRARLWMEMRLGADGPRLAATEQLYLSVRQDGEPRAAPWREETQALLREMGQAHAALPVPPQAGKGISLKRA